MDPLVEEGVAVIATWTPRRGSFDTQRPTQAGHLHPHEWLDRAIERITAGRLDAKVDECRKAVLWLYPRVSRFDPRLDFSEFAQAILSYAVLEAVANRLRGRPRGPDGLQDVLQQYVDSGRTSGTEALLALRDLMGDQRGRGEPNEHLFWRLAQNRNDLMHGNALRERQFEYHLAVFVTVLVLLAEAN